MCFSVRTFEAISAAAFSTASFAILAYTFPSNVATMFVSDLYLFLSVYDLFTFPEISKFCFISGKFRVVYRAGPDGWATSGRGFIHTRWFSAAFYITGRIVNSSRSCQYIHPTSSPK